MKAQSGPEAGELTAARACDRNRFAMRRGLPIIGLLLLATSVSTSADDPKADRAMAKRDDVPHVESKIELNKDKPIAVSPVRGWVTLFSPEVIQHVPASSFCMVHVVKHKDAASGREEAATLLGNCNLGPPGQILDVRIPAASLAPERVLAVLNEATGNAPAVTRPPVAAWVDKEAKLDAERPLEASPIAGWILFHLREGPDVHVPVSAIKLITVVEVIDNKTNVVQRLTEFMISAEGRPKPEISLSFYSPESSSSPEKAIAAIAAASWKPPTDGVRGQGR